MLPSLRRAVALLLPALLLRPACPLSQPPPAAAAATHRRTVIDNTRPRRDTSGNILNAHDGMVFQHPSSRRFYLVGTSYTHCYMNQTNSVGGDGKAFEQSPESILNVSPCGFGNHDLALYSSDDLANDGWRLENPSLLPAFERPNGIYFRPKILYNALTKKFVLWFNYVTETPDDRPGLRRCTTISRPHANFTSPYCHSVYGSATSTTVSGPYSIAQMPITMGTSTLKQNPGHSHGDFAVFQDQDDGNDNDDDGMASHSHSQGGQQAYIVYNSYDKGSIYSRNAVDRLTPDFTASSLQTGGYIKDRCIGAEAQAMIKRNGTYFVVSGRGCGFCPHGSSAPVYASASPLGPYRPTGTDINGMTSNATCNGWGAPASGWSPPGPYFAIPSQQSFIVQLPDSSSGAEQWLWGGDHWQSANVAENGGNRTGHGLGLKSADAMIWLPMRFTLNSDGAADIEPLQRDWHTSWTAELPLPPPLSLGD